jgi:23S rRNA pseudouridine2605 synthase
VGSRRAAEQLIEEGRVAVNAAVVTVLGTKIDPAADRVTVDGEEIRPARRPTYLVMHKPKRTLTSTDDRGRPTVFDLVPARETPLRAIGHLDWDAEGAVILTDDAALAGALAQSEKRIPRAYLVKVRGKPTPEALKPIIEGSVHGRAMTAPDRVELVREAEENTWLRIDVGEARERELREAFSALGHPIVKLQREHFAGIAVGALRFGEWRPLEDAEIERLRAFSRGETPEVPQAPRSFESRAAHARSDRAPKRHGDRFNSRPPRGPRREGGFHSRPPRGPRREGDFDSRPPRGPRREGDFDSRPPRGPRREGGFDSRPPRGPRREGDFDSRPPRTEHRDAENESPKRRRFAGASPAVRRALKGRERGDAPRTDEAPAKPRTIFRAPEVEAKRREARASRSRKPPDTGESTES